MDSLSLLGDEHIVFFCSSNTADEAEIIIDQAIQNGFFREGYAWLVFDTLAQDSIWGDLASPTGLIGFRPSAGFGSLYDDLLLQWPQLQPSLGSNLLSINTYSTYAYDAVFAFAWALKSNPNATSATLLSLIREVHFQGLTGSVQFDVNGDRLYTSVSVELVNWRSDSFEVQLLSISRLWAPAKMSPAPLKAFSFPVTLPKHPSSARV